MSAITNESTLDNNILAANGGVATTGTFQNNVTENTAPTAITTAGELTLDGANHTLTSDGTDAALIINAMDSATIENLSIAGSSAAISIGNGGTAMFADDGDGDTNEGVISGAITGAGGISVAGGAAEPLYLTAVNTYTGATAITTGDLVLGNNGSIASSMTVTVAATGILDISSAQSPTGGVQSVAISDLSGAGAVYVGRNTLSVTDNTNETFSGVISNSASATAGATIGGGLTVQAGSGAFTLSGANTYSGPTKIFGSLDLTGSIANSTNVSLKAAGATLDISGNANAVTLNELTGVAGTSLKLGANALTVVENFTAASFSGVISGTGAVTIGNAPTTAATADLALTLAGVNTYTGATTITENASLAIGAGGSISASTSLADNGTFDITAASGPVTVNDLSGATTAQNAQVSLVLGANKLIDHTTAAETFGGVISGSGALQVGATSTSVATGSLTLNQSETYTGSTLVYGDLILGAATGSIADSSNVSLKVSGATFDVTNGQVSASAESSTVNGTNAGVLINELTGVHGTIVTLGANNLIITETANASFSGVIGGTGGIEVDGAATLTLMGANTYTGTTTIYGDLALGTSGAIAAGSMVFDDGVFDISGASGGAPITIASLTSDSGMGSVVLGANTLEVTGAMGGDFGGVISGTGSLEVGANGALTLEGANTYTGTTTILGGATLTLMDGGSIASSSSIANAGALVVETTTTLASMISGAGTLTVTDDPNTTTAAVVTLTGADIYTGATTVTGGSTLAIGAGGSIAQTSSVTLGTGAAAGGSNGNLDLSQATGNVTLKALASTNAGDTIVLGANSLIISGPAATNTIVGVISGSGGLQVSTGDTVSLSGTDTYTGATKVFGTLDLTGSNGSISDSSGISLKSGSTTNGVFDISGITDASNTVMMNTLSGQTGTMVNLDANTLVVNEMTTASFSGIIAADGGAGGLTVDGSSVLTLAGANTYTGVTTIGGSLDLATSGTITDSTSVVDNGMFAISSNATINNLSGTGSVSMGTNTLTVDETHASTSATSTTGTTFSGAISGAGVFNFQGTNTAPAQGAAGTTTLLTLSGSSTYSGGTHLGGGTLEVASLHAVGTGAITFADAATAGNNSVLQIDNAALTGGGTATESFANAISGMSAANSDSIDLSGLSFSSVPGSSSVTSFNGHVVVTEGNVSVTLNITDATTTDVFHVFEDSHGGTYVTLGGTTTTPDATHYHP